MSNPQVLILAGVVISAGASIAVAVINIFQNRRIADIHILVNDRLERALAKIEELKLQLEKNGV